MSTGIYSALSGAVGQERNLNVVANNVANATTTGYKADAVAFNRALAAQAQPEPERNASLNYTQLTRVEADLSSGALERTGRPLDFAVVGDGFFTIRTAAGERLTRDGSFVMDVAGRVLTQDGDPVLIEGGKKEPKGKELRIPPGTKEIALAEDGQVQVDGGSIGRLRMRAFAKAEDAKKIGNNLFVPNEGAAVIEPTQTSLVQGSLESSNLNAVQGLTQMITANRSFDALQKIIKTFQSLEEKTARGLGQ